MLAAIRMLGSLALYLFYSAGIGSLVALLAIALGA